MKKIGAALVVGAGVSGIRSSLDLAEQGYQVTLIDKAAHLGGILAQLEHQFPTDHCGMCKMLPVVDRDAGSQFCLRKGLFHENITIMLSTQLVSLEGEPGRFEATLSHAPTMVDPARCMGCGECSRVCPVEVPDRFNTGWTTRKAIHLPVPHQIPNAYVVDTEVCTLCGACEKVCPSGAIDFGIQARQRFRILVVDDELVVRDSLKEWLEDEGFGVDTVASGAEALDKIAQGIYHLMLLDIKMPGMDGVEVLRRARETTPELPVVMMTAYATVETAVEAMKIGALDYLLKPFDPDALVPMIVQLHQKLERAGQSRLEVGAVILAAGFEPWNPALGKNTYGYGELADVVSGLEFERLISACGPHRGRLLRPSDAKPVTRVAWIQCVGSRDLAQGADFCSSACCMFSIKEAVLAREKIGESLEASIFYMDMRTFGKEFERYRQRAEQEMGVRFIRSRVHSVEPLEGRSGVRVVYVDLGGKRHEAAFDLVVLATGQRPSEGAQSLAETTGVNLNPWGFCETKALAPGRTSRPGVFAGGAFSAPRDIGESVIHASAASLAASKLIHSQGGSLAEPPPKAAGYRDVTKQPPQVAVAICTCNGSLGDVEALSRAAEELNGVADVHHFDRLCTEEGWKALQRTLSASSFNRLLIGACMPYLYSRRLRELGESLGLDPSLMEVVDLRTLSMAGGHGSQQMDLDPLISLLAMGVGRVRGMDPEPSVRRNVKRAALVVGAGIAGMTAALAIADHGYPVTLVEKESALGGNLRWIQATLEGEAPQDLLRETVSRVENHPKIVVYPKAKVTCSKGIVGEFESRIEKEDGETVRIDHGVTILTTGGREAQTTSYGYGKSDAILTQMELEMALAGGKLSPESLDRVVMLQCVDSREEPRNYCSRVCCGSALKHALRLKSEKPAMEVIIFYRDMMTCGLQETHFTRARRAGIVFVPYRVEEKPRVSLEAGKPVVRTMEPILGRLLEIRADLLVLGTGIVPRAAGVADVFGVELNRDGFFQEAESKWRPVDFVKEGVFMAGLAHSPRFIGESVATAEAAATRALRILGRSFLPAAAVVATVRHSLCARCQRCIEACPYQARSYDRDEDQIIVDQAVCQGCGSCAAVCLNGAAVLGGYRDSQVFEMLDGALQALS